MCANTVAVLTPKARAAPDAARSRPDADAAFVCRDEPSEVRTHLVPREAIADDDQVALYLDTFHDGRHAYVFASNPSGVQQDGIISEGDDPNYTADMLWHSQGRVTADGFVVLIAIPFKSLRFSAESVQSWRIAVSRTVARRSESAFWPYITRRINGFVRQMAALEGLELISPGRNVQLTPYGTFARAQSFDPGTLGILALELEVDHAPDARLLDRKTEVSQRALHGLALRVEDPRLRPDEHGRPHVSTTSGSAR